MFVFRNPQHLNLLNSTKISRSFIFSPKMLSFLFQRDKCFLSAARRDSANSRNLQVTLSSVLNCTILFSKPNMHSCLTFFISVQFSHFMLKTQYSQQTRLVIWPPPCWGMLKELSDLPRSQLVYEMMMICLPCKIVEECLKENSWPKIRGDSFLFVRP